MKGTASGVPPRHKSDHCEYSEQSDGESFYAGGVEVIRDLCVEFDVLAITDEIYEHILYDGTRHISLASLDGMRERAVTINGMSKTYSVTGWRVGWAVAPEKITNAIRKVHDFLTVGAPAPLQEAGAMALSLPAEYYAKLAEGYRVRRITWCPRCRGQASSAFLPRGAYYVMTDIGRLDSRTTWSSQNIWCGSWRGGGAGVEFLSRSARWGAASALCLLQKPETLDAAAERLGTCGCGSDASSSLRSVDSPGSHMSRAFPPTIVQELLLYFVTTPQAMRSPELPEGSVFISSAWRG